jgi:hypothetical protein
VNRLFPCKNKRSKTIARDMPRTKSSNYKHEPELEILRGAIVKAVSAAIFLSI